MSNQESNVGIWKEIVLPYKKEITSQSVSKGVFAFSPLPKGYGITLGNALRRVLLSSMKGSAISSVKIQGVQHSFGAIAGIKEDTIELIANLKKVAIKTHTDNEYRLYVKKSGHGIVTAADLADQGVDILNPDQIICHLDNSGTLNMECVVTTGIGYVMEEELDKSDLNIGTLCLDTLYNPVRHAAFDVENINAGSKTYEKLIITVETNGTMEPKTALSLAASILTKHLSNLSTIEINTVEPESSQPEQLGFDPKLLMHVSELGLTGRAKTCVEAQNIQYLGDLVILSEEDLLELPNVGKNSVTEIKNALARYNLELGLPVADWKSENAHILAMIHKKNKMF